MAKWNVIHSQGSNDSVTDRGHYYSYCFNVHVVTSRMDFPWHFQQAFFKYSANIHIYIVKFYKIKTIFVFKQYHHEDSWGSVMQFNTLFNLCTE